MTDRLPEKSWKKILKSMSVLGLFFYKTYFLFYKYHTSNTVHFLLSLSTSRFFSRPPGSFPYCFLEPKTFLHPELINIL